MSLALDYLSDYLERTKTTQADYAKSSGIDPSLFTKLVQKEVAMSGKNLPKLLRGIREDRERLDFLTAYLRDQIPADFADSITIHLNGQPAPDGGLMESGEEESLDAQIAQSFAALPSDLYRRRVIRFLNHLKKDGSLRDLFSRTVAYLEESDAR